ncbi:MAG: hypothetical protein ACRC33_27520, partial [Gemmataceae bacterium]
SFLLASAVGVGAGSGVVQTTHAAPVASAPAAGCCTAVPAPAPAANCGCAPAADCGCATAPAKHSKSGFGGLFAKKVKATSSDCGCAPAPAPCAAPAPAPCAAPCDPCATASPKHSRSGGGLFSGLFGGHKKAAPAADCGCAPAAPAAAPCCGSAAAAPATVVTPAAPVVTPAPAYHGTPVPAQAAAPVPAPAPTPMPLPPTVTPAVPPIKKLPAEVEKKVGSAPAVPTITPASAKTETGASNPFDLDRRYDSRVAHAADFSSLTGKLTYVHADGGLWVLRYASIGTEDANGGAVILASDRRMASYREGDLVTVSGRVLDKKGSSRLGAPLFQANDITLVERAR